MLIPLSYSIVSLHVFPASQAPSFHFRYSYDYGLVHFIMMSTEHDMGNGSKQYTWLENDLKNVNRAKTPWIIIAGHRPMYTSQLAVGKIDCFKV